MGLDGAGRWFAELERNLGDWAQHQAGVEAADAPAVAVPPDVPPGLARVWSTPELLHDPELARWTVGWFGAILEEGFRVLSRRPPGPGEAPAAAAASWAATVFGPGVTAAAARATMPDLVASLHADLPGLERGLPWRPDGDQAAAAEATASVLLARLSSSPRASSRETLMELIRRRRDRRLAAYAALAAGRLDVEERLRGPASRSLAEVLTRFLDGHAPVPAAPDPVGVATIFAMRAWTELEWEAGLARERGGGSPPVNWRVAVAQRTQRVSDEAFRFALGRPPETVGVAAAWQAEADLDLCDAIRFADPETDARPPAVRVEVPRSWFRARLHRGPRSRHQRPRGRPR